MQQEKSLTKPSADSLIVQYLDQVSRNGTLLWYEPRQGNPCIISVTGHGYCCVCDTEEWPVLWICAQKGK